MYNSINFQLPQTFQVLPSGSLEVRPSKVYGIWAVGPVAPFLPPPTMKSTLDPFVASSPPRFQMWVKLFVYLVYIHMSHALYIYLSSGELTAQLSPLVPTDCQGGTLFQPNFSPRFLLGCQLFAVILRGSTPPTPLPPY